MAATSFGTANGWTAPQCLFIVTIPGSGSLYDDPEDAPVHNIALVFVWASSPITFTHGHGVKSVSLHYARTQEEHAITTNQFRILDARHYLPAAAWKDIYTSMSPKEKTLYVLAFPGTYGDIIAPCLSLGYPCCVLNSSAATKSLSSVLPDVLQTVTSAGTSYWESLQSVEVTIKPPAPATANSGKKHGGKSQAQPKNLPTTKQSIEIEDLSTENADEGLGDEAENNESLT